MIRDVAVAGGGPAGLYTAALLKRRFPESRVTVFEQNAADATYGFGVVFSDRALDFLRGDDEDTYQFLLPHMETWADLKIVHRDEHIAIDGNGFAAIGRLELLQLLQQRCTDAGVDLQFETAINDPGALAAYDLVVAADGANSTLRTAHADDFGFEQGHLGNRFAWYGTSKPFDCLSLTFRQNDHGTFCAHHYRYAPDCSTFIVECDADTFTGAGLQAMSDAESRAYCEAIFAPDLEGHPLMSNRSIWRQFPLISNRHWFHRNIALLGDALRTVHFSIGSGTRLAMEDAIALVSALEATDGDVEAGLALYEANRRPIVEKLLGAANASAQWYERMADKMPLAPYAFAHDYMTRTGRVSDDRLRKLAPRFMANYATSMTGDGAEGVS